MSFQSDFLQAGFMGDLTTLQMLQHRCRMTDAQAASFVGVSPHTYRRWRTDRTPSVAAVKLLAVMAGYVPWTKWDGWEVHGGLLFPPGYTRHGIGPGDMFAITFLRQQVQAQRERIEALESEIQMLRQQYQRRNLRTVR